MVDKYPKSSLTDDVCDQGTPNRDLKGKNSTIKDYLISLDLFVYNCDVCVESLLHCDPFNFRLIHSINEKRRRERKMMI